MIFNLIEEMSAAIRRVCESGWKTLMITITFTSRLLKSAKMARVKRDRERCRMWPSRIDSRSWGMRLRTSRQLRRDVALDSLGEVSDDWQLEGRALQGLYHQHQPKDDQAQQSHGYCQPSQ